jgi:AmmeMemoRadiSam system protein B
MSILNMSREKIKEGLSIAGKNVEGPSETVRVIFSPNHIEEKNFEETCRIYSRLNSDDYDTAVVVESSPREQRKKLPMPSHKAFTTPLGEVPVNDKLRNEFCDEDDDFFIDDEAHHKQMGLYDQLMLLQCRLDDFSVVSIQITDEEPAIVKELAYVLEEVLASRPALIVICCDLPEKFRKEFNRVTGFIKKDNLSGMMNYLNSGESKINGIGSFVAGVLISKAWGLRIAFQADEDNGFESINLLSGFAEMTRHHIFG